MTLNIVTTCDDGNVIKITGKTIKDFERGWEKYLQNEKGIWDFV